MRVTLRARLTAAFLAVVLGPVLLGAVFVGTTVTTVSRTRSAERLDLAAAAIRTAVGVSCQRLQAAAQTAALLDAGSALPGGEPGPGGEPTPGTGPSTGSTAQAAGPRHVVDHRLATAVVLSGVGGNTVETAGTVPDQPWAECSGRAVPEPDRVYGLASRAEIRNPEGVLIGYATAIDLLDAAFMARLADAGGTEVSLLGGGPVLSTEPSRNVAEVTEAGRELRPGGTTETEDGRYVRRLAPEPGQPLTLVISARMGGPGGLYAVLVAVVLCAGVIAVAVAWGLARSTTRPLTELSVAVDRVAAGDLAARVPVRSSDEVGRLGTTFNRMTREMQGYVQALTASRDQLRRQLGILGDTLSSTHDLNRIMRVILQTATAATGAQAGVVLLADPATGVLVGQCSAGLVGRGAPADVTDLRLRAGEGLLGGVAASGEPRRGRIDRDGPTLAPNEPHCLTYIAVPFSAPVAGPTTGLEPAGELAGGSAAMGVLALYDRHGFDEFDDGDLVTLRTFAGQAAVALDNVRVHEEAQRLSLTDALTGLSNYRYLRESLRREVERASRFGHTLAVLVLDLDHFKEINDTYGHAAGDAVLAEFARRVRAEIREVDFAFRQGGEEFVVLLPETDSAGAIVVAQRLGDAVRRTPVLVVSHQTTRPLRIPVTVSVGAAVYPLHGESGLAVLEAADDALYAAKAAGRNTFSLAGRIGD